MEPCPVCGNPIKAENLSGHLSAVHPKSATADQIKAAQREGGRRPKAPRPARLGRAISPVLVLGVILVAGLVGAGVFIASLPPPDIENPFMCINAVVGGVHFHPRIRVSVDGNSYDVPDDVGAAGCSPSIGILHTHPGGEETDGSGYQLIHVEGPSGRAYRLKHFMDVWGIPFSSSVVGPYDTLDGGTLRMLVDGAASQEWENLRLADGQRIEILYTS